MFVRIYYLTITADSIILTFQTQSFYLLVHNSNSSLAYMYPTQIKQDFIGKHKYWMAQPLLPTFDINHVKRIYHKYEKKLSSEDQKRNKKLKIFVFN